jgi:hypothetical protein
MTTTALASDRLGKPLLLAPLIFVAHFLEEAPGFVAWFNAHVPRGIDQDLFWTVNVFALIITLVVVGAEWSAPSGFTAGLVVLWFGFLMLANALFHIVASIADRAYMPGLITALVLYLPFSAWILRHVLRRRLSGSLVVAITVAGMIPMLLHGYLIIFRGSRLF